MIRVQIENRDLEKKLNRLRLVVSDGAFDKPVDAATWKAYAQLVELTPKKYTGLTRRAWQVAKIGAGQRMLFNDSKAFFWLEHGTGHSTGGYIYPKSKSVLFIPLNARAALGGWNDSLKMGTDYILRRRVRGITARHIVRDFTPKAQEILRTEMVNFLKQALT